MQFPEGLEFISRSARTPNFMNTEFQFSQFKVLQSVFFLFNVTSYIGIFECNLILIENSYVEKILKK